MRKSAVKNKVAIVGLSRGSISAPFDDKSFEIWTLNRGCQIYKDKEDKKEPDALNKSCWKPVKRGDETIHTPFGKTYKSKRLWFWGKSLIKFSSK